MIKVDHLTIQAGAFRLEDISFSIPTGQCGVLMGTTGCGKTTVLEAVCGLKRVLRGRVYLEDREVTALRPAERGIGFVPQDVALFSAMTVYDQLAFGPRIQKWTKADTRRQVEALAEDLSITHLLKRKPPGLSGGERQRVAIGRALSPRPAVLCMDEPLSALDEETHGEISALIKTITRARDITTLHITHSRREAEDLADCLFCFEGGAIRREDDPGHP